MNTGSWLRCALRALHRREKGQTLVLAAFSMVVVLGLGALVIDIGSFMHGHQKVENAVDAAALAAAHDLPVQGSSQGSTAVTDANNYLTNNDPELQGQGSVTFRCIIGQDPTDHSKPRTSDIPAVCDPGTHSYNCNTGNGTCVYQCVPSQNNKCNTVVVAASKQVPFVLAPVLGIFQDSTGTIRAAACSGPCGTPPTIPLDLVIIIDRTASMSTTDLDDAKDGARAALQLFNPSLQHVGLAVLPQSTSSSPYYQSVPNSNMNDPGVGKWVLVGLTDVYKNADGTLKESSTLVSTIGTDHSHGIQLAVGASNVDPDNDCVSVWPGGDFCRQTDLGDAVNKATYELLHGTNSRPNVKKGIILLTDGGANQPRAGRLACKYASDQATIAKAAGIEIFTIGYGVGGTSYDPGSKDCEDLSLPWKGWQAPEHDKGTQLLADMATNSADDHSHCNGATNIGLENTDLDHFLCQAKGAQLTAVFQQAVVQMTGSAHLIQVPPD